MLEVLVIIEKVLVVIGEVHRIVQDDLVLWKVSILMTKILVVFEETVVISEELIKSNQIKFICMALFKCQRWEIMASTSHEYPISGKCLTEDKNNTE